MLVRDQYLDTLKKFKDINLIKVITGVRRSGKSVLLLQFKDYLLKEGIKEENIIYINFESIQWDDIRTYKELYDYIKFRDSKKRMYILLDEVQNVIKWEKAVNSMLVDFDCDIYITGSNAYLLSSELTTLLAGRVITLHIYPLSFKEFINIYPFDQEKTYEDKLNVYLRYGGMPMLTNMQNDEVTMISYLNDVRDVVIKKDVIARNSVRDIILLDNLIKYMGSVIGNFTSTLNITNALKLNGMTVHNETIENYLRMLENAYIIYRVPRYELGGKQLLKTQGKYYFVDLGIRNVINGFSNYDSGSVLENVVYLELLRRGYQVFVGKYKDLEIDFVAIKPNDIKYYQVTKILQDENVEIREKKSLLAISDNYDKFIITTDKSKNKEIEGIKVISLLDFLLE